MKKVNVEVMIKLIIIIGFALFYYTLVKSGEIVLYVHPRIVPYAKISIVGMFIIVVFLAYELFKARTIRRRIRNYFVFIIPFIMMLSMKPNAITKTELNDNSLNLSKSEVVNSNNKENKQDDKKINLDTEGPIKITDSNYVNFLNDIESNPNNYIGKDVEIIGFIYKEDGMKENQFALVRNMMVCCAADMQMVGLMCYSTDSAKYDINTWVKVNGHLELSKGIDKDEAVINVINIEKVEMPKTPYVYPY